MLKYIYYLKYFVKAAYFQFRKCFAVLHWRNPCKLRNRS